MRKLVLLMVLCCTGCTHMANDSWTGKDKAEHFVSSAVLSAAGSAYGDKQHWSEGQSASFGLMFALSLGAAKELYDSREGGSGWSWKDFSWDVAGAATGYTLWSLAR
ncbi:YfiM family lipoprotein [Erwinia billingiae]|uniref:YfiM family lipoprotein n=1 Tax=Erwinia billingiae TaxID=182337 RepID=UPI001246BD71|nr:YfiM family lipoprotein [Erwinia billingiae]QEW31096.1 YfiM family lipoprotein [Erwinia billingiae]